MSARKVVLLKLLRTDPDLRDVVLDANALRLDGRRIALFVHDTMAVKLTEARVTTLVADGVGVMYDVRARVMRDWLLVTNRRASWYKLLMEAHGLAGRNA